MTRDEARRAWAVLEIKPLLEAAIAHWVSEYREEVDLDDSLITAMAQAVWAEWERRMHTESLNAYAIDQHSLVVGERDALRAEVERLTGAVETQKAMFGAERSLRDAAESRLTEHAERERRLREALTELYAMIKDGALVRNTTNDGHLPSFMAEGIRLVKVLSAAQAALASPELPIGETKELGRRAIGIELNAAYLDLAAKRLRQVEGQE